LGFENTGNEKIENKEKAAKQLNSLLYNCIGFINKPTENIIIGDSRIRNFSTERIKEITGKNYYLLYSNAAKLNEMIFSLDDEKEFVQKINKNNS